MKNAPIGIFDSGIGGLTIANAIKKILPNERLIYFGDTKHLPYGEKSKEAIQSFSESIIEFLTKKKCKVIVIACNSAASIFNQKKTRDLFEAPQIFNVIDPVIQQIAKKYQTSTIGIIGTKATIGSKIYEKKIKQVCPNASVCCLATPLLAPMIEEEFVKGNISQAIISNYLSNKKLQSINQLILACTHYPLIQQEIKHYYNKTVNIINSSDIVAKHIAKELKQKNILNKNKFPAHHFYVSNYTRSFEKSAKFFFKQAIKLKEIKL